MNSGNASLATTEQLLTGALHALEIEDKRLLAERKLVLTNDDGTPMTSVSWNPSHDSAQLKATMGVNAELLLSNVNKNNDKYIQALAVIGECGDSRYVAFGGNPFSVKKANNEQMNTLLKNTIRWLAGTTGKDPITLRIAQLSQTYWFPHEKYSRAWFDKFMPEVTYNGIGDCDGANLDECTKGIDVLVVSQRYDTDKPEEPAAIAASVKRAMDAGVSILYLHNGRYMNPLGEQLFGLMDVVYRANNYWNKARLDNADPTPGNTPNAGRESMKEMLRRVRDRDVDFETADIYKKPKSNEAYVSQIGACHEYIFENDMMDKSQSSQ